MSDATGDPLRDDVRASRWRRSTTPTTWRRAQPPFDPARDLGAPGEFPFTRGIHATMYRGQPVDDAPVRRLRHRRGVEPPLQVPAGVGADRAVGRVRSADADGPRLRPPAGARRGRAHRRRDLVDRGHARAARRHPARRGVDVDDHQRHGGDAARALRRGRRRARHPARARCRARSRTTSSRSTSRAGRTSIRPAPSMRLVRRHVRLLPGARCRAGTRSASAATTSARPAATPCRRSRSRSPTASPTSRPRAPPAWPSTTFAPRLSFFFNAHTNLLEEVAKFRAARRLWARIMRDRFGAQGSARRRCCASTRRPRARR